MEEDLGYHKVISIILALGVATCNATLTITAKFMMRIGDFNIIDMTSDMGLAFAINTTVLTIIFLLTGSESINLWNISLVFVNSCLGMIVWLIG